MKYETSISIDSAKRLWGERWKIRTLINIAAILQLKILQFQSLSRYLSL